MHNLSSTSWMGPGQAPGSTAAEAALDLLREQIVTGALTAGTKLNQSRLASELGMSRIPIRDALRALAAEGLVIHDPHRTATVASFDLGDLEELYELRLAVEPLASARAVTRLRHEDLAAIRVSHDALADFADPATWLQQHDHFHTSLYRCSGRPRMIALLDRTRAQTRRYTWIRHSRGTDEVAAEHMLIMSAIERGDADSVEAMVRAHLSAGRAAVAGRLAATLAHPSKPADSRPTVTRR